MISFETEKKILLHFSHGGLSVGKIAKELNIHRETVRRVLSRRGFQEEALKSSPKGMIVPFIPFIKKKLEDFPNMSAARLWRLCRDLGYQGGEDHFRAQIRIIRPRRFSEAFLVLNTLPGEQGQVDWGHFGKVPVGNTVRRLSAFVMVLSWSRKIYLEFFFDQRLHSFLEGHNNAFQSFHGVPKTLLYDNLKSVVLERDKDIIRFNPDFRIYAEQAGFTPQPVGVRKGNEKGRVERAIRYIRGNFFEGREFKSIEELNEQAKAWCEEEASRRRKPDDPSLSISQAWKIEMDSLNKVPTPLPPCEDFFPVRVKKTPYVTIDGNEYSVPHILASKIVTVSLSRTTVIIWLNGEKMAEHARCYERKKRIENPAHIEELKRQKALSQPLTRGSELKGLLSNFSDYLNVVAEEGKNMGSEIAAISRLVDSYGPVAVDNAIEEVLLSGTAQSGLVTLVLDKNRNVLNKEIPLPVADLSKNPKLQNTTVKPHDPSVYDELGENL